MADWTELVRQTERYYSARVKEHGATARGVDWNSDASQQLRFEQFARLLGDGTGPMSIDDYGCGYGALIDWLDRRVPGGFTYHGGDVSEEMIARARARYAERADCRFSVSPDDLAPADYAVASGVFNVKLETPAAVWQPYVLAAVDRLAALGRRGFAFNLLTLDSDPDRRRPDLYYADPEFFFAHCRARYGRAVSVLQDYGLFEFTVIVRQDGAQP
jgi:SAM-dependent methyltransferase